ncbi:metal-dependent hydrolase [Halobacteriales archaeon SW_10_68_16]|nr:MAG: metal-dependent hydrolase [Halobacteriales archaeon SW_10_68_16]
MLFPTHLVAAYLPTRRWDLPPAWTVAGAALPDLVLVLLAVTLVGLAVRHTSGHGHTHRRVALAVWVGWTSYLLLDAINMPLNGRPGDARFLLWPAVEHAPAVRLPPLAFAAHYVGTPAFYLEVLVWVAFFAVLVRRLRTQRPGPDG